LIEESPEGRPAVRVDFGVKDVRLLYNAVDFYLENRIKILDGKKPIKDSTEDVWAMRKLLSSVILEYNFHSQ
tara:strand:+ start:276 stop:491 length:216 start_codon:yes stop_codon:yes gene_type:complete